MIATQTFQDYECGLIPILSKNRQNATQEYNYDVLTRILFIYAKLHDGFYVQGMNEIVALVYNSKSHKT